MQGKKHLQPKMLYTVTLEQLVPRDNFYRRLNQELTLHWLYAATKEYYGEEGQESIDPVVFFKMCIVGYINNISSDRKLADYCADSLGIRLFLGYDIDEALLPPFAGQAMAQHYQQNKTVVWRRSVQAAF